jgi:molybdopterin/thiamine biosynthesis adenylyltransferase
MRPMHFFDIRKDGPCMTQSSPVRSTPDFVDLRPDGRFSRHEEIRGWSQKRLSEARVLVVGSGALGNEALKNLALLGIGEVGVIDFDVIELSNLTRCVLFREADLGEQKATVAARRIRELNPSVIARSLVADVMTGVGAGFLEDFDVVLGCVDNIAARYKLNRLCRMANVPWLNAGIDAFCGQVSFFHPDEGACYECTMTTSMWQRMYERNSCLLPSLLKPEMPLATTTILASLTAALQVQEAIAFLKEATQSQPWPRLAAGEQLSIRVNPYEMAVLRLKRNAECMAHYESAPVLCLSAAPEETTAADLLLQSGMENFEVDWDIAAALECPLCGIDEVASPAWRMKDSDLACPRCSAQRRPHWSNRVDRSSSLSKSTLAELGVPERAHLWMTSKNGTIHHAKLIAREIPSGATSSHWSSSI